MADTLRGAVLLAVSMGCGAIGCATAVHGRYQLIPVATDPPGATAEAAGQLIVTPGALKLPRGAKEVPVRVTKDGYESLEIVLHRRAGGAVWGNLGFIPVGLAAGLAGPRRNNEMFPSAGWMLGAAVALPALAFTQDVTSGAAYELQPEQIIVRLTPLAAAGAAGEAASPSPKSSAGTPGPSQGQRR